MKNKNILLGFLLGVMLLAFVSSAYPQFQGFSDNTGTLKGSGTATLGINVTNTNGTTYLNFDGVDYAGVNTTIISPTLNTTIFNVSLALDNEDGGTYAYYWYSYSNNATHNYNASATYNYVLLSKLNSDNGQQIYKTLEGAGAGMGIFLVYLSQSLPVLLILLAIIGIVVVIGLAIAHLIKNSIVKSHVK